MVIVREKRAMIRYWHRSQEGRSMRPVLAVIVFSLLTACSGGQFSPDMMDESRLPVNKKGNLFFGRELEW